MYKSYLFIFLSIFIFSCQEELLEDTNSFTEKTEKTLKKLEPYYDNCYSTTTTRFDYIRARHLEQACWASATDFSYAILKFSEDKRPCGNGYTTIEPGSKVIGIISDLPSGYVVSVKKHNSSQTLLPQTVSNGSPIEFDIVIPNIPTTTNYTHQAYNIFIQDIFCSGTTNVKFSLEPVPFHQGTNNQVGFPSNVTMKVKS